MHGLVVQNGGGYPVGVPANGKQQRRGTRRGAWWGALLALATPMLGRAEAPPAVTLHQSLPAETELGIKELGLARDAWLGLCRGATRSLDIGQFYATSQVGSDLELVIDAIAAAGQRGVKIRFLVDSRMRKESEPMLARLRALRNLELRVLDWHGRTGGVMHAKYWVADGARAYIGSQNFDWRALQHIHEIGALINEPALARQVAAVFQSDWELAAAPVTKDAPALLPVMPSAGPPPLAATVAAPPPLSEGPALELFASPPQHLPSGVRWSLPALVELLGRARRGVRLQLLSYSPQSGKEYWPTLDTALRQAAVRGVKVQILLSDWSVNAPAIDHIKSLAVLPNISVRIVHIPPAREGFIPFARVVHSKYLVLDDEVAVVGTSNWSRSYFLAARNLEVVMRSPVPIAQLGAVFDQLWQSRYAEALDLQKTYQAPRRTQEPAGRERSE